VEIVKLIKYIFLGMVQGFTEPLPISSSGHVYIFSELLGIEITDINFGIVVNAGSLIAIVIVFRKRILELIVNVFKFVFKKQKEFKNDFNYAVMLIIAVIPAGIAGLLLENFISEYLLSLFTIGVGLLITAIALTLVGKEAVENKKEDITFIDALVIGLFQVFTLVPGISRSGGTMVGGLSRKIRFEDTMRFSFLLYIPISVATLILGMFNLSSNKPYVLGYIFAFVASLITTFFAVKWFFKMVRKGNLKYFSIYCTIVGIALVIVGLVTGS